jgi:hypothetical protein
VAGQGLRVPQQGMAPDGADLMALLTINETLEALLSRMPDGHDGHELCSICNNVSAAHLNHGVTDRLHCGKCHMHWPCNTAIAAAAHYHITMWNLTIGLNADYPIRKGALR